MPETPQFKHDCDWCIFLGRFNGNDLYVCPDEPTVVSRASDEGSDYWSGLSHTGIPLRSGSQLESLHEAERRAKERKLL